jgi:hypothetical protein
VAQLVLPNSLVSYVIIVDEISKVLFELFFESKARTEAVVLLSNHYELRLDVGCDYSDAESSIFLHFLIRNHQRSWLLVSSHKRCEVFKNLGKEFNLLCFFLFFVDLGLIFESVHSLLFLIVEMLIKLNDYS